LQPVGHLLGQAFLDLEVAGEEFDYPGQLGQPEEPLAGQVADVGHPRERQEVVLAEGLEGDAPGQDQLVVAFVVGKGGEVEFPGGEQLGIGAGHSPGCLGQVVRGRVVTQGDEEIRDRPLGRFQVNRLLLTGDP
jgi:hypothetical protein